MAAIFSYETSFPGVISIDTGDGLLVPYRIGGLDVRFDLATSSVAVNYFPFDAAPIISKRTYSAIIYKVDGSTIAIANYAAAVTWIKQYFFNNTSTSGSSTVSGVVTTGGTTSIVRLQPTVATLPYAQYYVMDTAKTIGGALRINGGTGTLASVFVQDTSGQKPAFDILIFCKAPVGLYTDQIAFVIAPGDVGLHIATISVTQASYITDSLNSYSSVSLPCGLPVGNYEATTNLYALFVCQGTPTFGTSSDLTISFSLYCD